MTMLKKLTIILLMCFLVAEAIPAQAQSRRSSKKDSKKEQKEEKNDFQIEVSTPESDSEKPDPQERQSVQSKPDDNVIEISRELIERMSRENNQIIEESEPVVTEQPNGRVNWTEQFVEAKGATVIDRERFSNEAQAKAMATRGAVVVAQRNLLEIVNGVQVNSETVVVDMVTISDEIHTKLDGVIRGATMVGDPVENLGMMEVTMRVPLYGRDGIANAVYQELPQQSVAREKETEVEIVSDAEGKELTQEMKDDLFGSLVFDYNGKKIDPSMFPVILDENGNLLLDLAKIYDPEKGKFPVYLDASRELLEGLGVDKGVEIIDVISASSGTIKIDSSKTKSINWEKIGEVAGAIGKFLLLFL